MAYRRRDRVTKLKPAETKSIPKPKAGRPHLSEERIEAYFKALERGWTYMGACKVAGISRMAVVRRRRKSDAFRQRELDCYTAGTSFLEDTARKRATKGKSDTLLMALLKARDGKFQPKPVVTVEGQGGGPIVALLSELPED